MEAEKHINKRSLKERLDGNYDLFRELAEMFIANSAELLSSLEKAIRERDAAAIGKAAHTIKGAVANFSADGAFAAAYEIEKIGKSGELNSVDTAMESLVNELKGMTRALNHLLEKKGF
ncbi:MAG: Hpt domain-containing protein [Chrysiogenales bacterium]|nr:MAG: Hpt domain-containing protein [Chrysiogenales bacterium]